MTRRVTPKQFKILQLLKSNPAARIPVTWWKTLNVYESRKMERKIGRIQNRTVAALHSLDLLINEDSQWYMLNPRVTNLDVSRHWVTVAPKPLPLVK